MAGYQRTVFWKTMLGKTLPVVFDDATTMGDLRVQVQTALQVPSVEDVRLVVYGREHEDAVVYATLKPETMCVGGHVVIRSAAAPALPTTTAEPSEAS